MNKILLTFLFSLAIMGCKDTKENVDMPCDYYFMEMRDDFEKSVLYRSKDIFLHDNSDDILGSMYFSSINLKSYAISISLLKRVCTDENSKIIFLFNDDSTSESRLINSMNCEGNLLVYNIYFTDFNFKEVKGFRIKGIDNDYDFYLNTETIAEIKKVSSCYYSIAFEKAKTL